MVQIIRDPAIPEQINQMAETYFGLRIKLAVDVAREILAGGSELHADWAQTALYEFIKPIKGDHTTIKAILLIQLPLKSA